MRILATADLHGIPAAYDWVASEVGRSGVDALVLAGDLLGVPEGYDTLEEAQRADAARIRGRLADLGIPVLYVMGNDDWVDLDPDSPRIQTLHRRRVDLGGFGFVGYACTLPFMGGPNERPDADQERELQELESWLDERTVLVTHGPAAGTMDRGVLDRSAGSLALARLLSRCPHLFHVHGHIHGSFGREGRHLNVAAAGRGRGMLVDLRTLDSSPIGT